MAQTEAETRKLEDYRPNHSLDRIGTYIRLGLMGVSVLFAAYIGIRQVNEQAQPNEPQPAFEHAFVDGDEEEPKVGEIYYLRNDQEKAGRADYFKVRVRNKVSATFGAEIKVFLVIIEELDELGKPIPGTQNSCLVSALFNFDE